MLLFWSTNDTFSIIDALLKLILVITCSALIICFCHRLTNYKKKSRYRYKTNEAPTAATAAAASASQQLFEASNARFYQRAFDCSGAEQPALAAHLFAAPISTYDPYNRPAIAYPYLSVSSASPSGAYCSPAAQLNSNSPTTFDLPGSSSLVANPAYTAASISPRYPIHASSLTLDDDQCPSYEEAVGASLAPTQEPSGPEPENSADRQAKLDDSCP